MFSLLYATAWYICSPEGALKFSKFLTDPSLPVWNLSGSEYILSDCHLCAVLLCTLLDPKYLPALLSTGPLFSPPLVCLWCTAALV